MKCSGVNSLEENLADFKIEVDELNALLDERIEIEKETLELNSLE